MLRLLAPLAAFFVILASSGSAGGGQAQPTPAAKAKIRAILADKTFWGADAPSALLQLGSWRRAGETNVHIFANYVLGASSFPNEAAARKAAQTLNTAMRQPPPRPNPESAAILQGAQRNWVNRTEVVVVPHYYEDESIKVNVKALDSILFKSTLSMVQVVARLGQPEKTRQVDLLNQLTERRPVSLKFHDYAGGAVSFVESNYAPPGAVTRIVLSVPAVNAAIF